MFICDILNSLIDSEMKVYCRL